MDAMTAIVLAGGRPSIVNANYPELPTALIPVAGAPFLHWLTLWLKAQGILDIVFAGGYKGEKLLAWAGQTSSIHPELCLDVVIEGRPQGTGGAIALCAKRFPDDYFIILNGDCLLLTNLKTALAEIKRNRKLDGIILGTSLTNAGRFGALSIDDNGNLTQFNEKRPNDGLINAGIYILKKELLDEIVVDKSSSIEVDYFPKWLNDGRKFKVICSDAPFVDIGTPESLAKAEEMLQSSPEVLKRIEEKTVATA
jgi:D-glycero-alpha-D-manno-heptose 1-phosphate guanylyltransferase